MSDAIAEMKDEARVIELHRKFLSECANPAAKEIHQAGIARFENLGFPQPKHEMFTFVNTHELASTPRHPRRHGRRLARGPLRHARAEPRPAQGGARVPRG